MTLQCVRLVGLHVAPPRPGIMGKGGAISGADLAVRCDATKNFGAAFRGPVHPFRVVLHVRPTGGGRGMGGGL